MCGANSNVRFGPKADIGECTTQVLTAIVSRAIARPRPPIPRCVCRVGQAPLRHPLLRNAAGCAVGNSRPRSLIATRVGTTRQVVCGSPDYFAAKGTPKSPEELRNHDCVTFDGLMSPADWKFVINGSPVTIAVHSRLVVSTAEAAIDAAIMSVGVTRVLSYQAADAMHAGRLALALEEFEPAPWPVSLVYAGQGLLPLKVRAFLDFASPRLKARLLDETKGTLS
jgi:DNA-binding transcriptional LysR family regulator